MTFFIHIQLCVQLRKPSRLFSQFFFLWERLFHFDLRRFLLLFQGSQFVFGRSDSFREIVQRIIQPDDAAKRVFAQCYRVFPLAFQKSLILAVIGVEAQGQFKAAITSDHFFLTIGKFGASEEKSFASSLFLIIGHALDGNATEALFLLRMGGGKFGIRFHPGNIGIRFLNVSREFCEQLIFQTELLALVVGFQHF